MAAPQLRGMYWGCLDFIADPNTTLVIHRIVVFQIHIYGHLQLLLLLLQQLDINANIAHFLEKLGQTTYLFFQFISSSLDKKWRCAMENARYGGGERFIYSELENSHRPRPCRHRHRFASLEDRRL